MSTSTRLAWVLPLLVAFVVVGCSSSGAASPDASLPVRPSVSLDLPPSAPASNAPVTGEVPEPVLQAIQQQLAKDVPGVDLVGGDRRDAPKRWNGRMAASAARSPACSTRRPSRPATRS